MRVRPDTRSGNSLLPALLIAIALMAGLYFSLRYAGWSIEVDASRQSTSADGILDTGSLVHARAYDNGYAYGAYLALVSLLTGLPVQQIQLGVSAWVFVVALAAFIAYRQFLGLTSVAALATVLLFIQPDFTFYILRGSHEKTTWAYALLMLFFLLRSYRHVRNPGRLVINVILFYLMFFAMTAGNAYFASAFINAVIISLAIGWFLERFWRVKQGQFIERMALIKRLLIISLTGVVIINIYINYLYRPALQYYLVFSSVVDRVSLLFLGAQPAETPTTYGYLQVAWRSPGAYLSLTAVQWAIAISSLVAWVILLRRLADLNLERRLLWLLYTGFGLLLAFSVVVDFAGVLNTNLQLRLFTPFCLFSSPLVASMIYDFYHRLTRRGRKTTVALGTALLVYAAIAAMLKVTNDPALGNQWLFYSPAELNATQWMDANLQNKRVWMGASDHLAQAVDFWEGYGGEQPNTYEFGWQPAYRSYILISQQKYLLANRLGFSMPGTADHNQIYDNGDAQLYHPPAWTPHQR